jgi:hypothetical protein
LTLRRILAALLAATCGFAAPTTAQTVDGQIVRTFVVERHVISRGDYERAVVGSDVRLAAVGSKPRPKTRFEVHGQGDVFTGWSAGEELPYRTGRGLGYEFVGSAGEVQPSARPGYRTVMMKDSRLVRFYAARDGEGLRTRVPLVRKSEVSIDFPLDGSERAQVYAIPRGKKKFEYRLVTVREDVSRRRVIRLLDSAGRP